ncbi:MAG TPA: molybdenum cofactor biosynthesis protein MoaE [Bacteroidia bacterium]|nr:molybdenum cofactor biosynthesis protein MoaE [Bacteroidia bacterium]
MEKTSGQKYGTGLKEHLHKNVFVNGAISSVFIAESISKHSAKKIIGAHSIFLGQVRNDVINGNEVQAIDYSTFEEMAQEKFQEIREAAFKKYSLTCLHIHHSIGRVNSGEINLFVFISSVHRIDAMEASAEIVERIKKEVPVWGKEIFEDERYQWKINS